MLRAFFVSTFTQTYSLSALSFLLAVLAALDADQADDVLAELASAAKSAGGSLTPRPGGDLNRPLNRLYHDCTKTSSSCLSTLKAVLASRAHQRDCTGKSHQRVPAGRQEGSGLERDSTRLPMDVRIPSLQGVNGIRHGRLCAPRHEWLADSSTSRRLSPPCKE